jgi:hypothetical protein
MIFELKELIDAIEKLIKLSTEIRISSQEDVDYICSQHILIRGSYQPADQSSFITLSFSYEDRSTYLKSDRTIKNGRVYISGRSF